jgi:hypothetical protein
MSRYNFSVMNAKQKANCQFGTLTAATVGRVPFLWLILLTVFLFYAPENVCAQMFVAETGGIYVADGTKLNVENKKFVARKGKLHAVGKHTNTKRQTSVETPTAPRPKRVEPQRLLYPLPIESSASLASIHESRACPCPVKTLVKIFADCRKQPYPIPEIFSTSQYLIPFQPVAHHATDAVSRRGPPAMKVAYFA